MGMALRRCGVRRVGGCLLALTSLTAIPAGAEPCRLQPFGTGTVAAVLDGRTVRLDDGREVRLAAIEAPHPAAKMALDALLVGQSVEFRKLGPDSDRYGRVVAHVTVTGEVPKPVQEALLRQGLVRVAARVDDRACGTAFLGLEQAAREAKLGLWGDPGYVLRRAENPTELLADLGRFAVIEGKVLSVRESGGTIYMNFGRRWTRDFAVTIAKRQERQFAAAGIEPKKLEGRQVRVRGWIEERGGPRVEASRPEQIEVFGSQ
jgi:endonuclease YncB( thermonuclease family)